VGQGQCRPVFSRHILQNLALAQSSLTWHIVSPVKKDVKVELEPSGRVGRMIDTALELFDRHVSPPPAHGNQRPHLRGVVGLLLAAAFEPAVRSPRTLDDLSLSPTMQKLSGVERAARSTLSDALAGFDHLISQRPRGLTMQFYVAVLMTLLIHLQTGPRVSKYALLWCGWVAAGRVSTEQMAQALARHERERQQDRKRRAKNQVADQGDIALKCPPPLPHAPGPPRRRRFQA
jgi:hypothetical protein